jgi:hypothetical protein
LEETDIASAYPDRFAIALAHDQAARAREFFTDASFPPMNQVSATDTWLELALIPSVGARHELGTGFISEVARWSQIAHRLRSDDPRIT